MTTTTMLKTSRFGEVEFASDDVVTLQDGLIGLPDYQEFVIINHREDSPFRWLQPTNDPTTAFLIVDPCFYIKNYGPEMPESTSSALELTEDTPILVYTICTIPNGNPRGMTLNLAGPIIINATSRQAKQIVLEDEACPVRFPVFANDQSEAA